MATKRGTSGPDTLTSSDQSYSSTLKGLGGNDTLIGKSQKDVLLGGPGNDRLYTGISGWDDLNGEAGSDHYFIQRESGAVNSYPRQIYIQDTGTATSDIDILDLTGLTSDLSRVTFEPIQLHSSYPSATLLVKFWRKEQSFSTAQWAVDTQIWIKNQLSPGVGFQSIEKIRYRGQTWDITDIKHAPVINSIIRYKATEHDDVLRGIAGKENIIAGLGGNDRIHGGTQTDWLYGDGGKDVLFSGTGHRTYLGGSVDRSGDPNGSDRYVVEATVSEQTSIFFTVEDLSESTTETDTLDITALSNDFSNIYFNLSTGIDDTLAIRARDSQGRWRASVEVPSQFKEPISGIGIERLKYGDNVWNIGDFADPLSLHATVIYGASNGNDVLRGKKGREETIAGLGGNDRIYGRSHNRVLVGGSGNDKLYTGTAVSNCDLHGGDYSYDTHAIPSEKNGNDLYVLRGRGRYGLQINIFDLATDSTETDTLDLSKVLPSLHHLRFRTGKLSKNDLTIEFSDESYAIYAKSTVTLYDQLDNLPNGKGIERIRFGSKLLEIGDFKPADVPYMSSVLIHGVGDGSDSVEGSHSTGNEIFGLGGDDRIMGKAFDDILVGGEGNDRLFSGTGGTDHLFGGGNGERGVEKNGSDTFYIQRDKASEYRGNKAPVTVTDFATSTTETDILNLTGFAASHYNLQFNLTGENTLRIDALDERGKNRGKIIVQKQFKDPETGMGLEKILYGQRSVVLKDYADPMEFGSVLVHGVTRDADVIYGSRKHLNVIHALEGDDLIYGGQHDDTLYGGDGNDTLSGQQGGDRLAGGKGNDTYYADKNDLIEEKAGQGNDKVISTTSHKLAFHVETLILQSSDETLKGIGNPGDNIIKGSAGRDKLFGRGGNDTISGGAGNDSLMGGPGRDELAGGQGNDTYILSDHMDTISESSGAGIDTIVSSLAKTKLAENVENANLTGLLRSVATGNRLDNMISGNTSDNILKGLSGKDLLFGNKGNDELSGGNGNDVLLGGTGKDTLTGGAGADAFSFSHPLEEADVIVDFDRSEGDSIVLNKETFGNFPEGKLSSQYFAAGKLGNAQTGDQYFVFNTASKTLFYDPDANGNAPRIKLATFSNNTSLTNEDIYIV